MKIATPFNTLYIKPNKPVVLSIDIDKDGKANVNFKSMRPELWQRQAGQLFIRGGALVKYKPQALVAFLSASRGTFSVLLPMSTPEDVVAALAAKDNISSAQSAECAEHIRHFRMGGRAAA